MDTLLRCNAQGQRMHFARTKVCKFWWFCFVYLILHSFVLISHLKHTSFALYYSMYMVFKLQEDHFVQLNKFVNKKSCFQLGDEGYHCCPLNPWDAFYNFISLIAVLSSFKLLFFRLLSWRYPHFLGSVYHSWFSFI